MVVFTAVPILNNSLKTDTRVICVICGMAIEPYNATAGSLYDSGHQAFACTAHLRNRRNWVISWTIFDIHQRIAAHARQGAPR